MSEILRRSLREAVLTLVAMLGTLACVQAFDGETATAVLGAVLSLSLTRSHLAGERRGSLEALLALPLVALASVGVGILLQRAPWAGAAVFVVGMALSIWMRRFGARALRAGALVALPLVTILVVPRRDDGTLPPLLAPVAVALVAMTWVMLAQSLGRRLRWLAPQDKVDDNDTPQPGTAGGPGLSPHTRMALQMAVALAASFVIGYLAFPSHWSWIVLTAFIVNSGNRGRQDVAYKGALRIAGTAAGTVVALAANTHSLGGPGSAALILASVFLGVWLRPAGYGWWALFVTLALALLQSLQPAASPLVLWQRLLEILIGAAIGIASAWWVCPIRSTDVLRKRIAEALATMSDALDPQVTERRPQGIVAACKRVEQLRPSFRARHLALRRWRPLQPLEWIDTLLACRDAVVTLVERGETPGKVRTALGAARKAMQEPAEIRAALGALREALQRTSQG